MARVCPAERQQLGADRSICRAERHALVGRCRPLRRKDALGRGEPCGECAQEISRARPSCACGAPAVRRNFGMPPERARPAPPGRARGRIAGLDITRGHPVFPRRDAASSVVRPEGAGRSAVARRRSSPTRATRSPALRRGPGVTASALVVVPGPNCARERSQQHRRQASASVSKTPRRRTDCRWGSRRRSHERAALTRCRACEELREEGAARA
jgi:hypothetical protein